MPYKRKDSPVWWASVTGPNGERVRRPTGTANRKEAEAIEAKWKVEIFRRTTWGVQPERTFDDLALTYLKSHTHKRTANKDRQHIRRLRQSFGGRVVNRLAGTDIRSYIDERKADGMAAATINRELEVLSAAINYVNREHEWGLPNPVRGRKLRQPEARVRWVNRTEAAALIAAARTVPHLADFIAIALNTGMRSGEILGLEWARVDLHRRLAYLEERHTKSARRRSVPLNKSAMAAILNRARFRAEHCPAAPFVFVSRAGRRIASVRTSFGTALRQAGIENFRIHDLRHTCAAWLVSAGVPLPEVRDLLGHASVKMTEKYAHLSPENVRAAVARLDDASRLGHAKEKGDPEESPNDLFQLAPRDRLELPT